VSGGCLGFLSFVFIWWVCLSCRFIVRSLSGVGRIFIGGGLVWVHILGGEFWGFASNGGY